MNDVPAEEAFVTNMVEGFAECASYEYLATAFETLLRMDFLDLSNGKFTVHALYCYFTAQYRSLISECTHTQAPTECVNISEPLA